MAPNGMKVRRRRETYPWRFVNARATKFSAEYQALYGPSKHRPEKLREYIQCAWQCGFEAGRKTEKKRLQREAQRGR
jgi:hypothetical protein